MRLRTNIQRLMLIICLMLCGAMWVGGCKERTTDDSQKPISYSVDKPFYKGPLSVNIRVDKESVNLSDMLEMEISATIEPDYAVQFPAVSETLKQFKVRNWKELPDTVTSDGKTIKTNRYQLEPLEMGTCEIGALTFSFKHKNPSDGDLSTETLTTDSLWIDVGTSIGSDPSEMVLADIADVVEMKANYTRLWITLGIVCLLGAGIAVGIAIRPKKPVEIKRVYKAAHDIAIETLRAIAEEKLVEQGHIKEFYEKLSTCLRQYIENRFRLRAPEQTTEEFMEHVKTSNALQSKHKEQLKLFLEHCDLVKFARYQPSNEQINESLTMAEDFVEKTKSQEHVVDVTERPSGERQVAS